MKKTALFVIVFTILLSTVIFAAPGDSNDPIVVLSYLNQRISSLVSEYKLDKISSALDKINAMDDQQPASTDSGSRAFEIVKINAGEKLIAESGTELILRGGEAYIIGSELGGITDVTAGYDFTDNMKVKDNHLLIVPRSDGRGVYTKDNALFMVRGAYKVVSE